MSHRKTPENELRNSRLYAKRHPERHRFSDDKSSTKRFINTEASNLDLINIGKQLKYVSRHRFVFKNYTHAYNSFVINACINSDWHKYYHIDGVNHEIRTNYLGYGISESYVYKRDQEAVVLTGPCQSFSHLKEIFKKHQLCSGGMYILLDELYGPNIIYVGKASKLYNRLPNHRSDPKDRRLSKHLHRNFWATSFILVTQRAVYTRRHIDADEINLWERQGIEDSCGLYIKNKSNFQKPKNCIGRDDPRYPSFIHDYNLARAIILSLHIPYLIDPHIQNFMNNIKVQRTAKSHYTKKITFCPLRVPWEKRYDYTTDDLKFLTKTLDDLEQKLPHLPKMINKGNNTANHDSALHMSRTNYKHDSNSFDFSKLSNHILSIKCHDHHIVHMFISSVIGDSSRPKFSGKILKRSHASGGSIAPSCSKGAKHLYRSMLHYTSNGLFISDFTFHNVSPSALCSSLVKDNVNGQSVLKHAFLNIAYKN